MEEGARRTARKVEDSQGDSAGNQGEKRNGRGEERGRGKRGEGGNRDGEGMGGGQGVLYEHTSSLTLDLLPLDNLLQPLQSSRIPPHIPYKHHHPIPHSCFFNIVRFFQCLSHWFFR